MRGLGRDLALHFARLGWNVACAARTLADVDRLVSQVEEAGAAAGAGGRALGQAADLLVPESLREFCGRAVERFARIDLCVCAQTSGLAFAARPLLEAPPAELERALAAAPRGTLNLLQAIAPAMIAQGAGSFVQLGTGSGLSGRAGFGLQHTAQSALRALVLHAAEELKPQGVHAAYLAVEGQIESERAQGYVQREGLAKTVPPLAIAEAVAWLHGQDPRAWTHELSLRPAASARR